MQNHAKCDTIAQREKIWIALSEFYLDTELNDQDLKRIATIFKESEFTLPEIKEIDLYEVFPVLQYNLNSVAGEWGMFDPHMIRENCYNMYLKKYNPFFRLKIKFLNLFFYRMRGRYWDKVEKHLMKS